MDKCQFCGFEYDLSQVGKYGCPNCEGHGTVDKSVKVKKTRGKPSAKKAVDRSAAPGLCLERGGDLAEGFGTGAGGTTALGSDEAGALQSTGRGVEQPEARVAHNHEVAGSSPASATTDNFTAMVNQGAAGPGPSPDCARSADPSPKSLFPRDRFV